MRRTMSALAMLVLAILACSLLGFAAAEEAGYPVGVYDYSECIADSANEQFVGMIRNVYSKGASLVFSGKDVFHLVTENKAESTKSGFILGEKLEDGEWGAKYPVTEYQYIDGVKVTYDPGYYIWISDEKAIREYYASISTLIMNGTAMEASNTPCSFRVEFTRAGGTSDIVFSDKDTVKAVQEALNNAGYECGKPDGAAGKKTKAAISAFQKDNGLAETGTVPYELMLALGLIE